MATPLSSQKPNYGIDAPGVIRNLIGIGLIILLLVIIFPVVQVGSARIPTGGFVYTAAFFLIGGLLMLHYSLRGKYIHRDRMLDLVDWTGNEHTLDIGTGKGLLMIGAARRLTTGKSIGIDIWNATDLTGNNYDNAIQNAAIEGVADKIEVLNENAMHMSFADATFDAIFTNLCIHNIYDAPGRLQACEEIARVLKQGGTAVIADFRHMREYKTNFDNMGLQTEMLGAHYLTTYPPLKILVVKK